MQSADLLETADDIEIVFEGGDADSGGAGQPQNENYQRDVSAQQSAHQPSPPEAVNRYEGYNTGQNDPEPIPQQYNQNEPQIPLGYQQNSAPQFSPPPSENAYQQMWQQASQVQDEYLEAVKQKQEYQVAFAESQIENFSNQISSLEQQRIQAREEGDSAKEVELANQIEDRRQQRTKMQNALEQVRNSDIVEQAKSKVEKYFVEPHQTPEAKQALGNWLVRQNWYQNPQTREDYDKRKYWNDIDQQMIKEGRDPRQPHYYQELESRLNNLMNGGQQYASQQQRAPQYQPPKQPVAPMSQDSYPTQGGQTPPNRITLTQEDQRVMRMLALDPTNNEHLKAYAREKRKHEQKNS